MDRMETMMGIRESISTHECPKCQGPAYCAMMDGKSISACWCAYVPYKEMLTKEKECLCKTCLTKEE